MRNVVSLLLVMLPTFLYGQKLRKVEKEYAQDETPSNYSPLLSSALLGTHSNWSSIPSMPFRKEVFYMINKAQREIMLYGESMVEI